ncbi:Pre-rRNA-processing protein IPI1 [Diplonema papillatum]|nr:Pre-rRNA-processing protein IPI1 [Diplonema papillatum]
MVQSKAKKADPKAAFRKAKQKVGKKKLLPVAATKAEIHATTLFMKKQTRDDTGEEYRNQRSLTLTDCLGKLKHYNANTRKEAVLALHGMVKVTVEGTALAIPCSTHAALFQQTLPLLSDADGEVRRAVVALVKVAAQLARKEGTLGSLLPLMVRYVAVALTHMDAAVRTSGCKALHLLCQHSAAGAPTVMPDVDVLLECCYRMLKSTPRPRDRVQPPVQQALISMLKSILVARCAAGGTTTRNLAPFDDLLAPVQAQQLQEVPRGKPRGGRKAAQTVEPEPEPKEKPHASAKLCVETPRDILRYTTAVAGDLLLPHWVEATQDFGRDTIVGSWELGLLEMTNVLLTGYVAVFQGTSSGKVGGGGASRGNTLPKKFTSVPRALKAVVERVAEDFPFGKGGAETARVNAQAALLLSFFFPARSEKIAAWVSNLTAHAHTCKHFRPSDMRAVCVTIERLSAYGGLPAAQTPALPPLIRCCGHPGTLLALEVFEAVHRSISVVIAHRRPFARDAVDTVGMVPELLFALLEKKRAEGVAGCVAPPALPAAEGADDDAAGQAALVPTLDGGAVSASQSGANTSDRCAFELLEVLHRYATCIEGLPEQLRRELVATVYAIRINQEWQPGLLKYLAPHHAALAVALLPYVVVGDDANDLAQAACIALGVPSSIVDGIEVPGGDRPVLSAVYPAHVDHLLALALELLSPFDLSECFDLLTYVSSSPHILPKAASSAADVLAQYTMES